MSLDLGSVGLFPFHAMKERFDRDNRITRCSIDATMRDVSQLGLSIALAGAIAAGQRTMRSQSWCIEYVLDVADHGLASRDYFAAVVTEVRRSKPWAP